MSCASLNQSIYQHATGVTLSAPPSTSRWRTLGSLACSALMAEASLTPKPALVDGRGSGVHLDLTLESMFRSALALEPYFQEMARISSGAKPNLGLREELGEWGRQAEIAMYQATGGSNSHRGAIWCLGLLVAAAAMQDGQYNAVDIAQNAARLAAFKDGKVPETETHGLLVSKVYGINGARAEAQLGFPNVTKVGLPTLERCRLTGATETSCRVDTLLAIMSNLDDTCLLYRGGWRALETAKTGAKEVTAQGGTDSPSGMARFFQLEADLLKLKASPGGSADLLAATLFLDSLKFLNIQNADGTSSDQ